MSENNATTNENVTEKKTVSAVEARTPHMAKVDKFIAGLPAMSEFTKEVFASAKDLDTAELNVLVQHLNAEVRIRGVNASVGAPALVIGQLVKITSGLNPKMIGLEGRVNKVQRIRCYVDVPGFSKPGYFFHSDLIPVNEILSAPSESIIELDSADSDESQNATDEVAAATGTEG